MPAAREFERHRPTPPGRRPSTMTSNLSVEDNSFTTLQTETLVQIFSYLDYFSLISLRATCMRFRLVMEERYALRKLGGILFRDGKNDERYHRPPSPVKKVWRQPQIPRYYFPIHPFLDKAVIRLRKKVLLGSDPLHWSNIGFINKAGEFKTIHTASPVLVEDALGPGTLAKEGRLGLEYKPEAYPIVVAQGHERNGLRTKDFILRSLQKNLNAMTLKERFNLHNEGWKDSKGTKYIHFLDLVEKQFIEKIVKIKGARTGLLKAFNPIFEEEGDPSDINSEPVDSRKAYLEDIVDSRTVWKYSPSQSPKKDDDASGKA